MTRIKFRSVIAAFAWIALAGTGRAQDIAPPSGAVAAPVCDINAPGPQCDMGTQLSLAGMPLQGMWQRSDFNAIEAQLQAWCGGKEHFMDGRSKLDAFESSYSQMFSAWKTWDADRQRLDQWRHQSPDSLARALVETIYWRTYAWHARGSGYAERVPKEAWELFGQRMDQASKQLAQSVAQSSDCPLWHSLNIATMLESGRERAEIETAYQQAVRRFPGDLQIHFAMARVYTAKWGGSAREFDQFARRATFLTSRYEGKGMYARLYWIEDCDCDRIIKAAAGGMPDWPLLKAGFEDLLRHYPGDTWNKNKYASLACRFNDKQVYLRLRHELGQTIFDSEWPESYSAEVCDRHFMTQS